MKVFNEGDISKACKILLQGGVVAIPSETVYGLAANALDHSAVEKIFKAKGRAGDNPLIVHISCFNELYPLVTHIPDSFYKLAERFWPGPLTIILKNSGLVSENVTAGLDTIAIRLPSGKIFRNIIELAGVPLAAPSANISGKPSATELSHILDDFKGSISAAIDGGKCQFGLESTVINIVDKPVVLRPGAISLEDLRGVLPDVVMCDSVPMDDAAPLSPGMKYKHYAPNADLIVVCGDSLKTANYIKGICAPNSGILCFNSTYHMFDKGYVINYGDEDNHLDIASRLFSSLRQFDKHLDIETIYAQAPSSVGIGCAINNRLIKAANFNIIKV